MPDATRRVGTGTLRIEALNLAIGSNTFTSVPMVRAGVRVPWIVVAGVAFVLVVLLPLVAAAPANLTSDESLYVAEAHNIAHGRGFTYPSGEPITHRAPLQPLLMAPFLRAAGTEGAYAFSKLVVVANVVLVALLAWRLSGTLASVLAAGVTAASSFLNGLGTTLYLDPLQCTFMLLSLTAAAQASRGQPVRWMAAAGVMSGLAFLVKESAVQLVPLGLVAWLMLPSLRTRAGAQGALAYTLAMLAVMAPWLMWVWWHTSEIFLIGDVTASIALLSAIAALLMAAFAAGLRSARARGFVSKRAALAAPAGIGIIVVHGALMLYALTAFSTWPYPNDYVHTVPEYLRTVATEAQPYFLLVAAWGVIAWMGMRLEGARLLLCAAALFAPFALFAANRGLQLRDALPLVYLSYVALAVAGAWCIERASEFISERPARVALALLAGVAGAMFAATQAVDFRSDNATASSVGVRYDSWESAYVRESAAWMEAHLPPGSRVLTSRLYFSGLHVHTEGAYEIRQLPTVRVEVDGERHGLLTPASNLFRWGDDERLRASDDAGWLYLKQFPGKRYWVGLSERDLHTYIESHRIEYVVLTGDDVAFSSLQLAPYLSSHPAFSLLHHAAATPTDQLFVYAVDPSKLTHIASAVALTPADLEALSAQTGLDLVAIEDALGQDVRVTDGNYGLSRTELGAALGRGLLAD